MRTLAHRPLLRSLTLPTVMMLLGSLGMTADPPASPTSPAAPSAPPAANSPATTAGPMHGRIYLDLEGKPVDLAEAVGKPMVIELWATWCGPCRIQRKLMHRFSEEFKDIVFIAVSTDEKGPQIVKDFRANNRADNPETSRVRDLMATPELRAIIDRFKKENLIPQTILVSRKGEIMDLSVGVPNEKFMRAILKNMTKAKASEKEARPTPPAPKAPASSPSP